MVWLHSGSEFGTHHCILVIGLGPFTMNIWRECGGAAGPATADFETPQSLFVPISDMHAVAGPDALCRWLQNMLLFFPQSLKFAWKCY